MFEGTVTEAELGHRYIIERPRLTQMLDDSNARIILLLAPAGYGKTTLARQWLSASGRRGAWYRAEPASADIVSLVTEVAEVLAPSIPGIESKVARRLRAMPSPDAGARGLGQLLADAARPWPSDLWLAIDDYQFIAASRSSDSAFKAFADSNVAQLIVTSRMRPTWATARRAVYDELTVIDLPDLALTCHEALAVLRDRLPSHAETVVSRAMGWTAVVRMAALAGDADLPDPSLPGTLHSYFAEEIFQAASNEARAALMALLPYPDLSPQTLRGLTGRVAPEHVQEAVELGFFTRGSDGSLDLHPLLREFLEIKCAEAGEMEIRYLSAFDDLLRAERWDEAFQVGLMIPQENLLHRLFKAALLPMLDRNRIATLAEWVSFASTNHSRTPLITLAEAAIARRDGKYEEGEVAALLAARGLPAQSAHRSRAYAIAAECAQHSLRDAAALQYAQLCEAHAASSADIRRALWAQLLAANQRELEDLSTPLQQLEQLHDGSAAMTVQLMNAKQLQAAFGGNLEIALREARGALGLVRKVNDPLVESSFLHRTAATSIETGHYDAALELARKVRQLVDEAGLSFALPHVTACVASARIGLRQFDRADAALSRLAALVASSGDVFQSVNWHLVRARLLLCIGAPGAAERELTVDVSDIPSLALRAELIGLRAVTAALGVGWDPANELIEQALATSRGAQGQTLARLARAIISIREPHVSADAALEKAEEILLSRGNWDSLVVAYRCFPLLLSRMKERGQIPEGRLARVVKNAHDVALARTIGWSIRPSEPGPLLSPREREVFDLMRQGLMNKEIAAKLFISPSTVKVHVRHILDKLGARSRTEAVMRLQNEA